MTKSVKSTEENCLEKLIGERITLFCCRYIYTGKLVGLDGKNVLLEDAGIVYETGEFDNKEWEDCQKLPNEWIVSLHSVESFGVLK